MLKHNVWYHIFYCSVNRNRKPQLRAAPQRHRHGVIVTSTPTPSWTSTTSSFCELLPAVRIFQLQRSCNSFIASSVTPPCIKKYRYSWSRSCYALCLGVFQVELLSPIRTSIPGRRGSQGFSACLTRKRQLFYPQKRNKFGSEFRFLAGSGLNEYWSETLSCLPSPSSPRGFWSLAGCPARCSPSRSSGWESAPAAPSSWRICLNKRTDEHFTNVVCTM